MYYIFAKCDGLKHSITDIGEFIQFIITVKDNYYYALNHNMLKVTSEQVDAFKESVKEIKFRETIQKYFQNYEYLYEIVSEEEFLIKEIIE